MIPLFICTELPDSDIIIQNRIFTWEEYFSVYTFLTTTYAKANRDTDIIAFFNQNYGNKICPILS